MFPERLNSSLLLAAGGNAALTTFLVYTLAVFGLAALSNRLLRERSFLKEYFLGSRSLGVWTLGLTFAATSASGGSFTGFPSLIYTHGWVLAFWIASYMIFPLCTMGLLGKRINQVARKTGAITVPDILRDRFDSRSFALLGTVLLVFFTCVNLVGQFKAGSVILQTLLGENEAYLRLRSFAATAMASMPLFSGLDAGYVLCLLGFGVAVIVYTTWGGFHAVVWTDVMQGIVMVLGVIIMLPLAISQAGGLPQATQQLAAMIPPQNAVLRITPVGDELMAVKGTWLRSDDGRVFRLAESESLTAEPEGVPVRAIEIVDAGDLQRIISGATPVPFSLALKISGVESSVPAAFPGNNRPGSFVTAPGAHATDMHGFLPMSLAFSMFFYWAVSGTGQPGGMVRLMAFGNTKTLRYSIVSVAIYFSCIYFPLVVIFCCSRLLLPGMETESDRVMPQLAVTLTNNIGAGWLAGILIAAPFAAVMSTVDSFLLMISSAIVRDLYQRNINPRATQRQLQRLSYFCTVLVGALIVVAALNPPKFLQYLIVYVGSGLAACFLAPVTLGLYWKRTTTSGATAAMLAGFLSHLALYVGGWLTGGGFDKPLRPLSLDPVVVAIVSSFAAGLVVSVLSDPPAEEVVRKFFYRPVSQKAPSPTERVPEIN
ncbi:MAG: hypothetical protein R3C49_09570 [Planctomycetaceae bacterium]